jgi:hypothetical protein
MQLLKTRNLLEAHYFYWFGEKMFPWILVSRLTHLIGFGDTEIEYKDTSGGRAITQAVSRWLLIVAARVQNRFW